jgi:hypothetical protein
VRDDEAPSPEFAAAAEESVERPRGRLRRAMHRIAADQREVEAEELKERSEEFGATPVVRCGDRQQVSVAGTIRSVTLRPRAGVPALDAELYDGSATVSLIWLGRRTIAGIEPGRTVVAHGRITMTEGHRTIFNPRYELRPHGT